ncbi:hypothetical protein, partial [Vibrio sp. 03_296]|uniref:hypothetical protein n=1 Tax=Vibrio sp. 03_296 TaxID=2024409 RepID=UPI002D7E7B4B
LQLEALPCKPAQSLVGYVTGTQLDEYNYRSTSIHGSAMVSAFLMRWDFCRARELIHDATCLNQNLMVSFCVTQHIDVLF